MLDLESTRFQYITPKLLNDKDKGKLDKFYQITGFNKAILIKKEYGTCIYYLPNNNNSKYLGVYNIDKNTFKFIYDRDDILKTNHIENALYINNKLYVTPNKDKFYEVDIITDTISGETIHSQTEISFNNIIFTGKDVIGQV